VATGQTAKEMRVSTASTMLLCCYLLSLVMLLTSAQNYHFSQGWLPGRKRSPLPPDVDRDDVVAVDSADQLTRLLRTEYNRGAAAAAAEIKQATDGSLADHIRPFKRTNFIGNPAHQYARYFRLVCNILVASTYSYTVDISITKCE